MKIKITWKYTIAFYCMVMLYVSLHELVHHFAGSAICGDWGYKTFNYFETACSEDEPKKYLANLFLILWHYENYLPILSGTNAWSSEN